MGLKRVYAQDYTSEFIMGGQIFKMVLDEKRRPYAEIPEHLEGEFYRMFVPMAQPDLPQPVAENTTATAAVVVLDGVGAVGDSSPAPSPVVTPWVPGMAWDLAVQPKNVGAAVEWIAAIDSDEHLHAIRTAEQAHPIFTGGRKGILNAIAERLAELEFTAHG